MLPLFRTEYIPGHRAPIPYNPSKWRQPVPVMRLEGKWNVNKNRLRQNRAGAIPRPRTGDPVSEIMSDLIAERDREP